MHRAPVDLAPIAREIAARLQHDAPARRVQWDIPDTLPVHADPALMRILLDNLLGNAFKFTSRKPDARIRLYADPGAAEPTFVVEDNGAGFDPRHDGKLFGVFQRLHAETDFPGTGIGLATVQRIVHRHGGHVAADGAPDRGAVFRFTLGSRDRAVAAGEGGKAVDDD
jgi:signal transduction histidine kinase